MERMAKKENMLLRERQSQTGGKVKRYKVAKKRQT